MVNLYEFAFKIDCKASQEAMRELHDAMLPLSKSNEPLVRQLANRALIACDSHIY